MRTASPGPCAVCFQGGSRDSGRLSRFGYGIMTAMGDSVLGPVGTSVPAHEFHHWDSPENGDCFSFKKASGDPGMVLRLWNGKPLRRISPIFIFTAMSRCGFWSWRPGGGTGSADDHIEHKAVADMKKNF